MRTIVKKIRTGFLATAFLLSASFIHNTPTTLPASQVEAASFEWGTINASSLVIRKSASTSSKKLATYKKGKRVKCLNLKTTWVKVTVGGHTGYVMGKYINTAYGTASEPYKNIRSGTVNVDSLSIRAAATTSSAEVTSISEGQKLQVLTSDNTWVKVKANGKTGYAYGAYISFSNGKTAAGTTITPSSTTIKAKGEQVVAYAKKFLGNRYVYGGTSLTNGTDCSGFTMRIYQHFGYSIPRTSTAQRSAGKKVSSLSSALPGDLICYSGHVALYMGNNTIIHASNAKDGIKISYNASYRTILAIRRILK